MAKRKSSAAYSGMGNIKGRSKEVNPTFSLSSAPIAKPATKRNVQLNPTFAAASGKTPSKSGAKLVAAHTRVNPTFSVAKSGLETSKGKTGRKLVMAKSKVGTAQYRAKGGAPVTPNRANIVAKNSTSRIKGYETPTRNIPGGIGKGRAVDARPGKIHTMKASKDVSVPTRNTSAPYGPNGMGKAPMTVSRLRKLGY